MLWGLEGASGSVGVEDWEDLDGGDEGALGSREERGEDIVREWLVVAWGVFGRCVWWKGMLVGVWSGCGIEGGLVGLGGGQGLLFEYLPRAVVRGNRRPGTLFLF